MRRLRRANQRLWGGRTSAVLRPHVRRRGAARSGLGATGWGQSLGVVSVPASAIGALDAADPRCNNGRTPPTPTSGVERTPPRLRTCGLSTAEVCRLTGRRSGFRAHRAMDKRVRARALGRGPVRWYRGSMVREPMPEYNLNAEQLQFAWDNSFDPVLEIEPGDTVTIETWDASGHFYSPKSTSADLPKPKP